MISDCCRMPKFTDHMTTETHDIMASSRAEKKSIRTRKFEGRRDRTIPKMVQNATIPGKGNGILLIQFSKPKTFGPLTCFSILTFSPLSLTSQSIWTRSKVAWIIFSGNRLLENRQIKIISISGELLHKFHKSFSCRDFCCVIERVLNFSRHGDSRINQQSYKNG